MWYFLIIVTSEYYAHPPTKFLHSPFHLFPLFACNEQSYDSVKRAGFGAYYYMIVPIHSMCNDQFMANSWAAQKRAHHSLLSLYYLFNSTVTNSCLLVKNTLSEVVLNATKCNLNVRLYCINTSAALEAPPFTSKMQRRGHTSARTSPEGSLYQSVTLFCNLPVRSSSYTNHHKYYYFTKGIFICQCVSEIVSNDFLYASISLHIPQSCHHINSRWQKSRRTAL